MACTQEPGDGAGSLVLVPQDPTSALQTAVLPNLHFDHLDKNALFDLLQAPGPPELRPSTQRYFDGAGSQGTSSHSGTGNIPNKKLNNPVSTICRDQSVLTTKATLRTVLCQYYKKSNKLFL